MGGHTLLHLGNEVLVEQATSLLVQGAVDGDNVTLSKHLLEVLDATGTNILLNLGAKGLVVVVEELLAVEGLQTAEDTLTNTADGNGTDDLALEVELVLGDGGNVPLTVADHLVGRDEVADEVEDGHDNVLGDGDDVAAGDFGDGDTTVGLVGSVEVDVVRANTSSDGDLEVLGLGQTLLGEITGVEATLSVKSTPINVDAPREGGGEALRSGDDDLGIDQFLVKGGVLGVLVVGGDESVTLALNPLSQAEFILDGTEKTGLLLSAFAALHNLASVYQGSKKRWEYLIENHKHFTLSARRSG